MAAPRDSIHASDKWNLCPLFSSFKEWTLELQAIEAMQWEAITAELQQKEQLSSKDVERIFTLLFTNDRRLKKLYTYAHLLHDEDTSNDEAKRAYKQASAQYTRMSEAFSWIEAKLISQGKDRLASYLNAPELKIYRTVLERIMRLAAHTLSENEEKLLAMASKATGTGGKAFRALSDADFHFAPAEDSSGKKHDVTHASYGILIRSPDRTLRESAFRSLHSKFFECKNSLTELLSGQVEQHWFYARAKHFSSCLDAALFPKGIDTQVYRSLIESVRAHLPKLHEYMRIRKEMLKVDSLHMWDLYVPLIPNIDISIEYNKAVDSIIESLKPLGKSYTDTVLKGLTTAQWVDKFENQSKRSGAYSSGCYDSNPYILMNYKNILRDAFTLTHEAGHSMHSHLSNANQPYHYAEYEIFVAEVASTFNEILLASELLKKAATREEKAYIINEKIEDIRGTLLRQTMFAEFELFIHELVEKNQPLTPALLSERYLELNREYFGPHVMIDPEIGIEWARIPHFYYNFYVYQYATGLSAALALADIVTREGAPATERYLQFLKSGSSLFPVELLKRAGVDMNSPEPVSLAMGYFAKLLEEFKSLALSN